MRFTFPQYLFPASLFRPHQVEADEDPTSPLPPSKNTKNRNRNKTRDETIHAAGRASFAYLVCKGCHTPCICSFFVFFLLACLRAWLVWGLMIVTNSAIISKGFAGRYGRGYLCHNVINVELGRVQERNLLTGNPHSPYS